jgi:hypothetical protein
LALSVGRKAKKRSQPSIFNLIDGSPQLHDFSLGLLLRDDFLRQPAKCGIRACSDRTARKH